MARLHVARTGWPSFVRNASLFPDLDTGNVEDQFGIEELLGSGFSSSVYKVYDKVTNLPYACKMLSKYNRDCNVEDVRKEVRIMQRLSGQLNVVNLHGIYESSSYVFLVMDLCSGGDLFDFIALQHPLGCSEQLVAHVMLQIMTAVQSCHAAGVMHGDVKPENIMLCESSTHDPLVKLIDFGLSKITDGEKVTTIAGTPCYMAPEVLQRSYGCESDIWSAGCIMYMLFTGGQPFNLGEVDILSMSACRKQLCAYQQFEKEFPSSEACKSMSESARDVLLKMLAVNPSVRLTADEFFQHPWAVQHMRQLQRADVGEK
jgi:calcium-dependent protein kinase